MKINPKYSRLTDFIEQIPSRFAQEGREIYHDRNQIRVITAPDGTELNVKQYCVPILINRLVYSLGIRKPKGLRAFLNPMKLNTLGIETPEPIAYIEPRNKLGLIRKTYFISIQCPYRHTMYEMKDSTAAEASLMAKAFALFTAEMHDKGVLHLDYSSGNILWDKKDDRFQFCIVDINRMKFGTVSAENGLKNLRRLWGSKKFFTETVEHYAAARNIDTAFAVNTALQARKQFWTRFLKKHTVPFTVEL